MSLYLMCKKENGNVQCKLNIVKQNDQLCNIYMKHFSFLHIFFIKYFPK